VLVKFQKLEMGIVMNTDFRHVKRDILVSVILTIVTCSIYGWVWLYCILKDLYALGGKQNTAGMDILLCFVTCGIYYFYLHYKMGKLEAEAYHALGKPYRDDSVLYVLLALFGFWIINVCIVQSNLNKLADGGGGNTVSYQ
jgi:hypothetical protein